jgi:hypothetical protein
MNKSFLRNIMIKMMKIFQIIINFYKFNSQIFLIQIMIVKNKMLGFQMKLKIIKIKKLLTKMI